MREHDMLEQGFVPGEPFEVIVDRIVSTAELGYDIKQPTVWVRKPDQEAGDGQGIYPLPECHSLQAGERALVTPFVRSHPSGGSVTMYTLRPVESTK